MIKRVKLTDCGPHALVDFDCTASLVGAIGPNGSGKSNVMEMVRYAITGETEENIDSYVRDGQNNGKVEVWFEKNGKPGYVMRRFGKSPLRKLEWDGREVTRETEVSSVLASIFGADKKALAQMVFVRQGFLNDILFSGDADRKRMFIRMVNLGYCESRAKLIDTMLPGIRGQLSDLGPAILSAKQELETAKQGVACALIGASGLVNYAPIQSELAARISTGARRQELQVQLDGMGNQKLIKQLNLQEQFGDDWRNFNQLEAELGGTEHTRNSKAVLLAELNLAAQELASYRRYAEQMREALTNHGRVSTELQGIPSRAELTGAIAPLEAELQAHWDYRRASTELTAATSSLLAAQEALAAVPVDGQLEIDVQRGQELFDQAVAHRKQVVALLEFKQEMVRCFQGVTVENRTAICPKCQLKVFDFEMPTQAEIEALVKQEADAEVAAIRERSNLEQAVKDRQLHRTHRQTLVNAEAGARIAVDRCAKQKQAIPVCTMEESLVKCRLKNTRVQLGLRIELETKQNAARQAASVASKSMCELKLAARFNGRESELEPTALLTLGNQIRDLDTWIQMRKPVVNGIAAALAGLRELDGQIARMTTELELLDKELSSEVSEGLSDVLALNHGDTAKARVDLESRQSMWQQAQAKVEIERAGLIRCESHLAQLEDAQRRDEVRRALVADLVKLKEMLSDDGVPMKVVAHHFRNLSVLTRQTLAEMGSNFTVFPDPENPIGFCFERTDGAMGGRMPMSKLSGGQKVRLCLAFLIAAQKLLVPEVGLLFLDEPSLHLDEESKESLAELLQSMAGRLQSSGHQVWVVDHAPAIAGALQKKIVLSKPRHEEATR